LYIEVSIAHIKFSKVQNSLSNLLMCVMFFFLQCGLWWNSVALSSVKKTMQTGMIMIKICIIAWHF